MNKSNRRPTQPVKSTYTPEYLRLGVEPVRMDVNNKDFLFQKKNPQFVTSSRGKRVDNPSPARVIVRAEESEPNQIPNSGQNQAWYNIETERTNEPIKFNEVPLPPESPYLEVSENPEESGVLNINPGSYCLFLGSELIYSTNSVEELEDILEMIATGDSPLKNVSFEDLRVMKCLAFKFGAMIDG